MSDDKSNGSGGSSNRSKSDSFQKQQDRSGSSQGSDSKLNSMKLDKNSLSQTQTIKKTPNNMVLQNNFMKTAQLDKTKQKEEPSSAQKANQSGILEPNDVSQSSSKSSKRDLYERPWDMNWQKSQKSKENLDESNSKVILNDLTEEEVQDGKNSQRDSELEQTLEKDFQKQWADQQPNHILSLQKTINLNSKKPPVAPASTQQSRQQIMKEDIDRLILQQQKKQQQYLQLKAQLRKKQQQMKKQNPKLMAVIKIQSIARRFLARVTFIREQQRIDLLLRKNKTLTEIHKFEFQCLQQFQTDKEKQKKQVEDQKEIERERFLERDRLQHLRSQQDFDIKKSAFGPVVIETLAKFGHVDMLYNPSYTKKEDIPLYNYGRSASSGLKVQRNREDEQISQKSLRNPQAMVNNLFSDGNSIISTFIQQNKNEIPQIQSMMTGLRPDRMRYEHKQYNKPPRPSSTGAFSNNTNKLGPRKNFGELIQKNSEEDISGSYSDTFEKESGELSVVNIQKPNQPITKNVPSKTLQKTNSKGSISIASEIEEDDYLKESFEQASDIQESIRESFQNRGGESRERESNNIDQEIPEGSSIRSNDQQAQQSRGSMIQEEIGEGSSGMDQYGDEQFESVSQEIKTENSFIGEDSMIKSPQRNDTSIRDELIESSSKFKKSNLSQSQSGQLKQKSVSFDPNANLLAPAQLDAPNYLNRVESPPNNPGFPAFRETQNIQDFDKLDDYKIYALPAQNSISNQEIIVQAVQEIYEERAQKEKEEQLYRNKYDTLKEADTARAAHFAQEEMGILKIEQEISTMLAQTRKINEKWRQETLDSTSMSTKFVTQKADLLYTKFHCQFERLIQSNTMSSKLQVLSSLNSYNKLVNRANLATDQLLKTSNTTGGPQKTNSPNLVSPELEVLQSTLENVEQQQEIIQNVLIQVLENVASFKQSSLDVAEMRDLRLQYDKKIETLLHQQEFIMRREMQSHMKKRDDQIKAMLQQLLDRPAVVVQGGDGRQIDNSRLKDILDQNKDTTTYTRPENFIAVGSQQNVINKTDQLKDSVEDEYPDDFISASGTSAQKSDYDFSQSKQGGISPGKKQQTDLSESEYKEDFEDESQRIQSQSRHDEIYSEADQTFRRDDIDLSVSWQSIDLWNNVSETEKAKINQKMSDHLVNFLTGLLMQEIKSDIFPSRQDDGQSQGAINAAPAPIQAVETPASSQKEKAPVEEKKVQEKKEEQKDEKKLNPLIKVADKQKSLSSEEDEDPMLKGPIFNRGQLEQELQSMDESGPKQGQEEKQQQKGIKQDLVVNPDIKEKMAKILNKLTRTFQSKKSPVVYKSIFDVLNKQNPQQEFIGNLLAPIKFFEQTDLNPQDKDEQLAANALEQQFKDITMGHIRDLQKKKSAIKDSEIIEHLQQNFEKDIEVAQERVVHAYEKLVSLDCYENTDLKHQSTFDEVHDFSKYKMVAQDDQDYFEAMDFQFQNKVKEQKLKLSKEITDAIFDEVAQDLLSIMKSRKNLK